MCWMITVLAFYKYDFGIKQTKKVHVPLNKEIEPIRSYLGLYVSSHLSIYEDSRKT